MKLILILFEKKILVKDWIVQAWDIPYSKDLASCNFFLFLKLKINLIGEIWDWKISKEIYQSEKSPIEKFRT